MFVRTLTYLFILFSVLSGCGDSPVIPDDDKHPADKAKQLEMQGAYQPAAQEYLQIAAQSIPPTQQSYQLSAINAFLKGNMLAEAKAELAKLDVSKGFGLEIPLEFVYTRIDLADQHVGQAMKRLQSIEPITLSSLQQIEYKQLHAQAVAAQGLLQEAIQEWTEIDRLANADPNTIRDNHQQLWRSLSSHNMSQIKHVQHKDDILSGWIALALVTKSSPPAQLWQSINNWKLRFPNHPATQHIVPTLVQNVNQTPPLQHIALLLPPSNSQYSKFAEAVKQGFLAAVETTPQNRPNVTLHHVDDRNVLDVYQKLVNDGVDFVVGPLLKDTLMILAESQPHLPVPTLGLNRLETLNRTGNLYQFGLSPEDEAKAVARRAWADGYQSAFVLIPEGNWGERVLTAFQTEWEKQGGQITTQHVYDNDFGSSIPKALRRQSVKDANMVFMVASSKVARQIRNFLTAIIGDRLPIYSTSHVYSGTPHPEYDNQIEGIIFVDMPWVLAPDERAAQLQANLLDFSSSEMEKYKRLYALGIDAYTLVPELQQLSQRQWAGQTGHLVIDNQGVIYRDQLYWARFVSGVPHLIEVNQVYTQE